MTTPLQYDAIVIGIIERLSADPWTGLDLLRVSRVAPWTLRLGSLS
jgi:hypothetical protein